MRLEDLRTVFRREMSDLATPPAWIDEECDEFANDAVMEAVRRGVSIIDSTTTDICHIAYTTNPVLALDPRVITIKQAIVNGQTLPLDRMLLQRMEQLSPGWRTVTAQYPTAYIVDVSSNKLRLYPTPTQAGTVYLTVAREPTAMTRGGDEPEIPARYHRALVYWMVYRARSKDDTETNNAKEAEMSERKFAQMFGERKSARNERWREEQAGLSTDPLV